MYNPVLRIMNSIWVYVYSELHCGFLVRGHFEPFLVSCNCKHRVFLYKMFLEICKRKKKFGFQPGSLPISYIAPENTHSHLGGVSVIVGNVYEASVCPKEYLWGWNIKT